MNDDPDIRQTAEIIDLGQQVETFLQSSLGRYLIGRAEDDIEQAVEQLKRANPDRAELIRTIQNQIHVAENIQYWLAEAVTSGYNAQREILLN